MLRAWVLALMFLAASIAGAAAEIDLALQNSAIQTLKGRRAERAPVVKKWKARQAIGEASSGLLDARPVTGQTLAEKKEVRDTVVSENQDRAALFRELALANRLPESESGKVAAAFAAAQRAGAAPAHLVQNPGTGEWVQRKDLTAAR